MGAVLEYDITKHKISLFFLSAKSIEAEIGKILRVKKLNLFNDLKKGVFSPEQSNILNNSASLITRRQ